jgi:hypothetical protein
MARTTKIFLGIAACLMLAIGVAGQSGAPIGEYAQQAWSWVRPSSGPVTQVVVIEESQKRPQAVAQVVLGKTSDELRKAGKWRLYDQNQLPSAVKPIIDELLKANPLPFVLLYHGDRYIVKPLPATDADLATLIQSQGGI